MATFNGTVKSTKRKANASGEYLGVIATGSPADGWMDAKNPGPTKVWFAAPTGLDGKITKGVRVTVGYSHTETGTGVTFLKRAQVQTLDGSDVSPAPSGQALDLGTFADVYALFEKAKKHLKAPAIRLNVAGREYKLYVATQRSRVPGAINVVDDRPYGAGEWYGRIDAEGRFTQGRAKAPVELVQALHALAEDPETVAGEYGQLTGRCCFCGRELTDERSTAVGYGVTCAKNYGLTWGAK